MIDELVKLRDFVPLFQTVVWVVFIFMCLVVFRKSIRELRGIVFGRISRGSSFKAGPIEIGEELKNLSYADRLEGSESAGSDGIEREKLRKGIYVKNRGLFLTHVLVPSTRKKYRYEVYVYIIRHKSVDYSDVKTAEFFFGPMWGNRVFTVENNGSIIGISTSAYAPFLCTCRIMFRDGEEIDLSRYIDFEMKRVRYPVIPRHVL